jgi:glycosyltransferase involved in cell wall biosynthesis
VLLLSARLSDRGGAERWLLGILARLQKALLPAPSLPHPPLPHSPLPPPPPTVDTLLAVGRLDPLLPAAEFARIGPSVVVQGLDDRGARRRGAQQAAARLRRLLDDFRPHVIHVNDITNPALLDLVAATDRAVLTVQDHRLFCPGRGKVDALGQLCTAPIGDACLRCFADPGHGRAMLDLTRRRLEAVAHMCRVTVLSRYMAKQLVAAGIPAEKIVVLPPFVDRVEGQSSPEHYGDPGHHLFASRLAWHKGVDVALAAAARLGGPLPLVVAGDGPLAADVAQAAAASRGRIRYLGWADRPALSGLLASARSLWLPSRWAEPFGIVGLEALHAGVPVIATGVGGIGEWLTTRCGVVVPPGPVETMAAAIASAADRTIADPAWARRLAEGGRAAVAREHDPERLMLRLLAIYQTVAGRQEGGRSPPDRSVKELRYRMRSRQICPPLTVFGPSWYW